MKHQDGVSEVEDTPQAVATAVGQVLLWVMSRIECHE